MGCRPLGKPPHPGLLLGGLHGLRTIGSAHPRNGLRRRHACENGHARQHGSGATAPAQAADLDETAPSRFSERVDDLLRRKFWILRESEVLPVDHCGGPSRLPARIKIEAERPFGIVDAAVRDR
jgi:hypothetical protein